MDCTGLTAVVVGGGQGIGREICLKLAAQGADIVVADISAGTGGVAEEVRQIGRQALAVYTDLRQEASVQAMANSAVERFGTVHCLVNSSGIVGGLGQIDEFSLEEWNESLSVNLTGMFLTCRYLLPGLKQQGGSIVNIASVAGRRPLKGRSPYCTTKAAVLGFTRSLAMDLGEFGIRVNAVSPGRVEGPRIEKTLHHGAAQAGMEFEDYVEHLKSQTPLHTFIPPGAVADSVAFLCSPASAFMTGADLFVNAGSYMV
ncbi:SDR family NAD(P)-dependent oxidoreductase [Desulfovibrio cuneatus]|uniref:SDR family NAD(P)-dependent oxidoreductase n=1 Tax=Desulfovibrio cuneatus TaxID=159728 RepID=UPI0003FC2F3C|nr:SDR family NAD(P)-dependent oxidoreductase [Desulfovibrio cuneatus]